MKTMSPDWTMDPPDLTYPDDYGKIMEKLPPEATPDQRLMFEAAHEAKGHIVYHGASGTLWALHP